MFLDILCDEYMIVIHFRIVVRLCMRHATQVPFRVVMRLNHLLPNIRANQQSTSEYSCNHDDLLPNEFKSGIPHNTQII